MYKIIHETWLTKFVDTFGDQALVGIISTIYNSGVFKFGLLVFITLAFVQFGIGIHRNQISQRFIFSLIAFIFIYPIHRQPSIYKIISAFSNATKFAFEKGVNSVISNSNLHSERSNMPPGLVLEMILVAGTAQIKSDPTRALLHGFVLNCLPNALTRNGEHATFDDLFKYDTFYKRDPSGNTAIAYREKVLDVKSMQNDNSYSKFRSGKNCYQGLEDMRDALSKCAPDEYFLVDRVVGKNQSGTQETTSSWLKNWRAHNPESKFANLARNLALARAASYEKSKISEELGNDLNSWWYERIGTDISLRESLISNDITSSIGYFASDAKDIIANATGNRWSFSLGASTKDLKERIELLPYTLASIRLLLKIILPFVLLTLFLSNFRFLFMWSSAWFGVSLTPAIISASRAIGNSILLSKLGIENLANNEGYKALAHGVDLTVAKDFLEDFTPLAYSLINQELTIIKLISGCLLVGGWIAGGGANGFTSWLSNSIQGTLISRLTSQAAGTSAGVKALPVIAGTGVAGPVGAIAGATVSAISLAPAAYDTIMKMTSNSKKDAQKNPSAHQEPEKKLPGRET